MENFIASKKLSVGTRVYYIDAHEDKNSDKYITITEIATDKSPKTGLRQRIFLHAENIPAFLGLLNELVQETGIEASTKVKE